MLRISGIGQGSRGDARARTAAILAVTVVLSVLVCLDAAHSDADLESHLARLRRGETEDRLAALEALRARGPEARAAAGAIEAATRDEVEAVRLAAFDALLQVADGERVAARAMLRSARDPSTELRKRVAIAAGLWPVDRHPKILRTCLQTLLEDANGAVFAHAIVALKRRGEDLGPYLPQIRAALASEEHGPRTLREIGRLGALASALVPDLARRLEQGEDLVPVLQTLRRIGPAAKTAHAPVLDILMNGLHDDSNVSDQVPFVALQALRGMGLASEIGMDTWRRILDPERSLGLRVEAVGALEELGEEASGIRSTLEEIAPAAEPRLHRAICRAVDAVAGRPGASAAIFLHGWAEPMGEVLDDRTGYPGRIERTLDGAVMVLIPAGSFLMGAVPGDHAAHDWELPRHEVVLTRSYYLDATEVTIRQYRTFAEATKRSVPYLRYDTEDDSMPIHNVTFLDARAFAAWAKVDLPTEAQWERAARAGREGLRYPWGSQDDTSKRNLAGGADGHLGLAPVGSYPANRWGLHDLCGNVGEWTADKLTDYVSVRCTDPVRPPDVRTDLIVRRGGGCTSNVSAGTSSSRHTGWAHLSHSTVGFRCARTLP